MTRRALVSVYSRLHCLPDLLVRPFAAVPSNSHHVVDNVLQPSPQQSPARLFSAFLPENSPKWKLHPCLSLVTSPLTARPFSAASSETLSDGELRAEVDSINDKFAEARDEIEMALESKDTVYFNEEANTAREVVDSVLQKFSGLLDRLDADRRGILQRSMGLKMEQLKGELEQLNHDHE